jgi:hypothetical protein
VVEIDGARLGLFGTSPDEDVDANDTAQELGRAGDRLQLTTTIVNC